MTFSFDPAAVGGGNTATVTYAYNSGTICGTSTAQVSIDIIAPTHAMHSLSTNAYCEDADVQTGLSGGCHGGQEIGDSHGIIR
jgi:hypothetical protein